jgi:hypothetical protein
MLRKILKNSLKLNFNLNRALSTSIKFNNKSNEDYTHFGFETVKTTEKAEKGENYILWL